MTQLGAEKAPIIPKDSVLIVCIGTVGKVGFLDRIAVINQQLNALIPCEFISEKFLYYWAKCLQPWVVANASATVNSAILNKTRLGAAPIPLPPLNEQRRIVVKIEALKARNPRVKEELEAIAPLLDQFRQSVLAATFRGDLTADWREKNPNVEPASVLLERILAERRRRWEEAELEKMKAQGKTPKDDKWKEKYREPEPINADDELPELPWDWVWVRLEQLSDIHHGYAFKSEDFGDSGPIVLTPGNFTEYGKLDFINKRVVRLSKSYDDQWILKNGDLLIVMTDLSQKKLILGSITILDTEETVLPGGVTKRSTR